MEKTNITDDDFYFDNSYVMKHFEKRPTTYNVFNLDNTNGPTLQKTIKTIAHNLMNRNVMYVGPEKIAVRIADIEFSIYDEKYDDPFSVVHKEKLTNGCIIFKENIIGGKKHLSMEITCGHAEMRINETKKYVKNTKKDKLPNRRQVNIKKPNNKSIRELKQDLELEDFRKDILSSRVSQYVEKIHKEKYIYRIYGSIIVKAIYILYNNEYIDGPTRVVDWILRQTKCNNVIDLFNKSNKCDYYRRNPTGNLYIYMYDELNNIRNERDTTNNNKSLSCFINFIKLDRIKTLVKNTITNERKWIKNQIKEKLQRKIWLESQLEIQLNLQGEQYSATRVEKIKDLQLELGALNEARKLLIEQEKKTSVYQLKTNEEVKSIIETDVKTQLEQNKTMKKFRPLGIKINVLDQERKSSLSFAQIIELFEQKQLFEGPRSIKISKKLNDHDIKYIMKLMRFIIYPQHIHNRKHLLFLASIDYQHPPKILSDIFVVNSTIYSNWYDHMNAVGTSNIQYQDIISNGDNLETQCKLFGYCKNQDYIKL